MERPKLPIDLVGLRDQAQRTLDQTSSPVVRLRLLRDVLEAPFDDASVSEATAALDDSKWVRQLAAEQHSDGSWGAFHTARYPIDQKIPTTEVALDRALALGLPREHPVLVRATAYLRTLLDGSVRFPEGGSEDHAWRIAHAIIPGSKLASVAPGDLHLAAARNLWARVANRCFRHGRYHEGKERDAHTKLLGVPEDADTWLMDGEDYRERRHVCKYRVAVLASRPRELNPHTERTLVEHAVTGKHGLSYLNVDLSRPPDTAKPSRVSAWLASWELLSGFRVWRDCAGDAMHWLCSQRGSDGTWDLGPRPGVMLYVPHFLPLSESWRPKAARAHDWTTRVLLLLKAYLCRSSPPLMRAFDHRRAAAERRTRDRNTVARKVLRRDDLGLCVSWPKTHWSKTAAPGASCTVLIDDRSCRVQVRTEKCNCRGSGWHEHRFLKLPASAGLRPNQRVDVGVELG